jgi:hypothetical protein
MLVMLWVLTALVIAFVAHLTGWMG